MGKLNHRAIDNGDVEVHPSDFPVEFNSGSVPYPDTTLNKSIDDDEMDHLLELFHSEHDENVLDVDIQMLQSWLVVAPTSKFYTVSIVLFHKYVGVNAEVTNGMLYFSMFVPTKANMKLASVNTGHAQGIGIILCRFTNYSIIYPVRKKT